MGYNSFWNQFLLEVTEPTFVVNKKDDKEVPNELTGPKAFFEQEGIVIEKELGRGAHGIVSLAIDKKTGKRFAVKMIKGGDQFSGADPVREVENYKFVKDNRESLGEDAKYLPVVYKAEMVDIPVAGQTMKGRTFPYGLIYMEELLPLPAQVARGLFAASRMDAKDLKKRDKRLFDNPNLVSGLIALGINLIKRNTRDFISLEGEEYATKRIMERFFTMKNKPERSKFNKRFLSKQAAVLVPIFIDEVYESMLQYPADERDLRIIEDYKEMIRTELRTAFVKAYQRPMISGGENLPNFSALKGLDQFFKREKEIEETFPETIGVRKAMKKFLGRGLVAKDVHSDNVMMRPKTNDIVIVDLGLFRLRYVAENLKKKVTEAMNKEVASCIIVDEEERVLIVRRSETDPWRPGYWDTPGGFVDPGEVPIESAAREAKEEANLDVENLQKVEIKPFGRLVKYFYVTRSYSGNVKLEPNEKTGILEHDDHRWVSLEELVKIRYSVVPVSTVRKALNIVRL